MPVTTREPRRDTGAAEVLGSLLMLTLTLTVFVLLSQSALDQARQTAAYIRGLVPAEGQGPAEPEECVPLAEGTWCKRLPRAMEPGERCVLDARGWQWCLEVRENLPPLP